MQKARTTSGETHSTEVRAVAEGNSALTECYECAKRNLRKLLEITLETLSVNLAKVSLA